jgi:hypothetical protein
MGPERAMAILSRRDAQVMEWMLFAAIIIDVYVIVFYRLMIGFYVSQKAGKDDRGFVAIFSLPSGRDLPEAGLRYRRRYWFAMAMLSLLIAAGVVSRYHVFTGANLP